MMELNGPASQDRERRRRAWVGVVFDGEVRVGGCRGEGDGDIWGWVRGGGGADVESCRQGRMMLLYIYKILTVH